MFNINTALKCSNINKYNVKHRQMVVINFELLDDFNVKITVI